MPNKTIAAELTVDAAIPVRVVPGFLSSTEADDLMQFSLDINWQQNTLKLYGREVGLPRLEVLFGDCDCIQNGTLLEAAPWPDCLLPVRSRLELESDRDSGRMVLATQYRTGADHVGWHSDLAAIAMITLGGRRRLQFRHKTSRQISTLVTGHGNLLMMPADWWEYEWRLMKASKTDDDSPLVTWTFRATSEEISVDSENEPHAPRYAPGPATVAIADIRADGDTQIRVGGLDSDTLARYTDLWREYGDECPLAPVKLMLDNDGNLWLYDGFHTRQAALDAGRTHLPALIALGTLEDARFQACFVQSSRGLSLNSKDQRHAIQQAIRLNATRQPPLSDRELARRLGCDSGTIRYNRTKLAEAGESVQNGGPVQVTRNGQTYTLNPSTSVHTLEEVAAIATQFDATLTRSGIAKQPYALEYLGGTKYFDSLDTAYEYLTALPDRRTQKAEPPSSRPQQNGATESTEPFRQPQQNGAIQASAEISTLAPKTERIANDFYPTPHPDKIVGALKAVVDIQGQVFDCCAGDGAIAGEFHGSIANDIAHYDGFGCDFYTDASQPESWQIFDELGGFDWCVTNPPYEGNLPITIIQHAFAHARIGVAFLLRMSFLEPCDNRIEWLQAHADHLRSVIYLNPRPSFRGDKAGGDQVTVAWMVLDKHWSWQKKGIPCPFNFTNWKQIQDA